MLDWGFSLDWCFGDDTPFLLRLRAPQSVSECGRLVVLSIPGTKMNCAALRNGREALLYIPRNQRPCVPTFAFSFLSASPLASSFPYDFRTISAEPAQIVEEDCILLHDFHIHIQRG